jgi:two-component system, NarL family, nitrate/nitrite response regulator NarL
MAIRVLLLDDHPLVLSGLEQLLRAGSEFEIVGRCGTAAEGLKAVEALRPDVLVLDLRLPDEDGLSLLRRLDPDQPPAVVVLTASQDEEDLLTAVRLGARGVVLKAMAPRVLEDCIRTVHNGARWLSVDGVDLSRRVAQRERIEAELQSVLTARELEIVRLVASRLDNQEIAARLSITVGTVKIHLHHVYDKLHLAGRRDLNHYLRSKEY